MTPTQHTDGAVRAAKRIERFFHSLSERALPKLIEIITEETAVKRDRLREALQELLTSVLEDWGVSERYKAIKKAKTALAKEEPDAKEN